MEAPSMEEIDENFRLDSENSSEDLGSEFMEKGKALNRRQLMRMVRKEKKTNFAVSQEKPLIWSYLLKRNNNSYRNFHN